MLQYRIAPEGGVRDVDETKRQVLVSYPWEVIDSYESDFERSSFDEELAKTLPITVWQHDRKEPIGRAVEWQKTHKANELVARFSDFEAVPRARQAFTQIRDGELTDWSYGFDRAISKPHPSGVRGQIRFVKARMAEISPVSVGSIPGAVTVGFRSVDVAALRAMVDDRQITPEEARSILGLDVPIIGERQVEESAPEPDPAVDEPAERERIEVRVAGEPETRVVELESGVRSVVLTIADDGTVSASGYSGDGGNGDDVSSVGDVPDADHDAGQLASAIDAACDAACGLLNGVDTTGLPDVVQQALALYDAAGVAADELLDAMGLPDPDEDGDRAAKAGDDVTVDSKKGTVKKVMPNGALLVDWGDGKSSLVSAADADEAASDRADGDPERAAKDPKKPYGDVEYADPKNGKYPIDTAAHTKAAWSYVNQADNATKYPMDGVTLSSVKDKIKAAAKKFGIDISDSAARSDDAAGQVAEGPEMEPVDVEMARATLDLLATR